MKAYLAKCTTYDPEKEYPESSVEILGVFSTPKLAKDSFTRKERRYDKGGAWTSEHICFRGEHEVEEYEIDAWRGTPKTIFRIFFDRYGKVCK